jgi:hypothetical protein
MKALGLVALLWAAGSQGVAAAPTAQPPVPATSWAPTPSHGGKLRFRAADVMKLTKDVVNAQPSEVTIAAIVASLKTLNLTHIAIAVPLNSNAEFLAHGNNPSPRTVEQFTAAWANAIHAAGLSVLWRGTFAEFEHDRVVDSTPSPGAHTVLGLYNFPFYVPGDPANYAYTAGLRSQQWWLGKTAEALTRLASYGVFKPGDLAGFLPEPRSNQNLWDRKWNFLASNNQPDTYGAFFQALKTTEDSAFARAGVTGVTTGLHAEEGSLFLGSGAGGGHWYPAVLTDLAGETVMDNYGGDGCGGNLPYSPLEMDCDLRDASGFYGKPIFLQEWADYWNDGTKQQAETSYLNSMYAVWAQLVREGKMDGFSYWGGWPNTNESILADDLTINYRGEALRRFFQSFS